MARIFLDTNIFIDIIHRKPEKNIRESLVGHIVYISPLSIANFCYIYRIKTPNKIFSAQIRKFQRLALSATICEKALIGPTDDLEDNIQLHSAADAQCEYLLTEDKKLLNMKFFGDIQIQSKLI